MPIYKLFPCMITLLALCMGVTAIKYTFENNLEMATAMVLVACFLDGIDGSTARLLQSSSNFGAQLDSLCDLVNFGVAPAIIIYNWQLSDLSGLGWGIVLVYTSCTALRLARYNVESCAPKTKKQIYFHGIASPCAAVLAITPLISTFQILKTNYYSSLTLGVFILFISLMMVSRVPTLSTKAFSIQKRDMPFVVALLTIITAALFLMPWKVIPILSGLYILSIPFTWFHYTKKPLFKSTGFID